MKCWWKSSWIRSCRWSFFEDSSTVNKIVKYFKGWVGVLVGEILGWGVDIGGGDGVGSSDGNTFGINDGYKLGYSYGFFIYFNYGKPLGSLIYKVL